MIFKLNKILSRDSVMVTDLELSQLRLINNMDYNWLILVPRLNNIIEITDLSDTEYSLLTKEIRFIAKILQTTFKPDKLNIAIIGNVISQMHVHVIGRYKNDKLFPKPVWGCQFIPYTTEELGKKVKFLSQAIANNRT